MLLDLYDRNITLFLNGMHHAFFDTFFYMISKTWVSIPLFALMLFKLYQKLSTKKLALSILLVVLGITVTDRVTSDFMKPYFQRPRPTHNIEIQDKIHTVKGYRGGKYGFASSHAANTFFFAAFMALIFRKKSITIGLFLWCSIISYSRIYLGIHYVGDILVGTILGAIVALILYKIFQYLTRCVSFFRK